MAAFKRGWLVALVLVFTGACAKIPTPSSAQTGILAHEVLADSTAVPPAWGNLVAVTPLGGAEEMFQLLWFQDAAGNVRVVSYDHRNHLLWRTVTLISRK